MMKQKIKEIIIAALIGAIVTFLTKIAEEFAGIEKDMTTNIIGGASSTVSYIIITMKRLALA